MPVELANLRQGAGATEERTSWSEEATSTAPGSTTSWTTRPARCSRARRSRARSRSTASRRARATGSRPRGPPGRGAGHGRVLDLDDAEARGDIARFLTPSAFPADREALLADAEGNNATAEVLERLQALPEVAPTRTSRTSGAPSAARSSTASDPEAHMAQAGGFELLEHTADVGIRARGATLEAVFEHATEGLAESWERSGRAPRARRWWSRRWRRPTRGAAGRLAERGAVAARGARRAGGQGVEVERAEDGTAAGSVVLAAGGPAPDGTFVKAVTYHRLRVEPDQAGAGWPRSTSMSEPRRLEPSVWEIPVGYVEGMRVPGIVFANDELFARAVEDRAVEQVANVATLPGIVGASYAMPDIHWGYGFPIGGVAATDVAAGGVVSPGGVGFDIGCGVRLLRSDLDWDTDVRDRIGELSTPWPGASPRAGRGRAAAARPGRGGAGPGRGGAPPAGPGDRGGGGRGRLRGRRHRARCRPGPGVRPGRHPRAPQLGSLGGGNHFLEVQVVDQVRDAAAAAAMGLETGAGLRDAPHRVAGDRPPDLHRPPQGDRPPGPCLGGRVPDRQLSCLPVERPEAAAYLGAMRAAGNFALANRHVLADGARRAFAEVLGRPVADLGMDLVYDVSHNLAKLEEHEVDGRRRTLCVHRKGATRALGPGHPDLPDRYREVGQPVINPGSMGTFSYVLAGDERAEARSFASTCHGAGRSMSRTRAKKLMSGPDLRRKLGPRGWSWPPGTGSCSARRRRTPTRTPPPWSRPASRSACPGWWPASARPGC